MSVMAAAPQDEIQFVRSPAERIGETSWVPVFLTPAEIHRINFDHRRPRYQRDTIHVLKQEFGAQWDYTGEEHCKDRFHPDEYHEVAIDKPHLMDHVRSQVTSAEGEKTKGGSGDGPSFDRASAVGFGRGEQWIVKYGRGIVDQNGVATLLPNQLMEKAGEGLKKFGAIRKATEQASKELQIYKHKFAMKVFFQSAPKLVEMVNTLDLLVGRFAYVMATGSTTGWNLFHGIVNDKIGRKRILETQIATLQELKLFFVELRAFASLRKHQHRAKLVRDRMVEIVTAFKHNLTQLLKCMEIYIEKAAPLWDGSTVGEAVYCLTAIDRCIEEWSHVSRTLGQRLFSKSKQ
ncbi:hypothetical protein B0O99DRAFT_705943 [Bisporella sp. PMI_857]|nr:hypothetical protein B0O99DRAFT_705943 [Bisporella sp. PMI_857]